MLLKDVHPGYIFWAQYEDNVQRLRENARANGGDRRTSPAREDRLCSRVWWCVAGAAAA
jgi:hypothetical protein